MSFPSDPSRLSGTFQVSIDENTYDIALENGTLLLNGEEVPYRFSSLSDTAFLLIIGGKPFQIVVERQSRGKIKGTIRGKTISATVKDERDLLLEEFGLDEGVADAAKEIRSPMPGLVLSVKVEAGEDVQAGQGLLVLEAMKMENELKAPVDGTISAVHASEGDAVDKDFLLVEME